MGIQIIPKAQQAYGAFNGGEIIENKPIGFPQDGGDVRPYSSLFYWAFAEAKQDSTIGLHPHKGFEIMSFVLKGHIRHFDTKLKEWRVLHAGDAQIIRSGSGISHAEFMAKDAVMFQIWMDPNLNATLNHEASYDDYTSDQLPLEEKEGYQVKTYIGQNSPFELVTEDVGIQEFRFQGKPVELTANAGKIYSIYVLKGKLTLNEQALQADDFVIASDVNAFTVAGEGTLFIIESPKEPSYLTYSKMMEQRFAR